MSKLLNSISKFFKGVTRGGDVINTEASKSNKTPVSDTIKNLKTDSILNDLNKEQQAAATMIEGYVRVIAGAGSGKTRALAYRFAYLVDELGVAPNNIMAVTFTNKAAVVMKNRIRQLIGDQDTAYINTFHGFCVRVLREDIYNVNYPQNFVVMDVEDQKSLLAEIYSEMNLTVRDFTYRVILNAINKFKLCCGYVRYTTAPQIEELQNLYQSETNLTSKIIYRYLILQRKNYALDFDDLINFVLYIYDINDDIKSKWQNRLQYIQVDEFQDVSLKQYHLVSILSKVHNNLFIVGDPDQTIYTWRGADVDRILNFDCRFPDVKTIFMNTNYRSSPEILNVSNSLIQHNKTRIDKSLSPIKPNDIKVLHYHAKNTQDEAEWIAKRIKSIPQFYKVQIAVLYRAHYVSRAIEEAFIKHEISYEVHSGISFYQRKEIKDVLCYLRLIITDDDMAFLRVVNTPKRNIGTTRLKIIKEYAEKNNLFFYESLKQNLNHKLLNNTQTKSFVDLIDNLKSEYNGKTNNVDNENIKIIDIVDKILKLTGYEQLLSTEGDQERLDNIAELKDSILHYEQSAGEKVELSDYLSKIALLTTSDKENNNEVSRVKLMTVHAAKGLEFPYVFVCGLNEGVFPSNRVRDRSELEEERRLAYVALTRAEKELYITDSEGFRHDGGVRHPSRFIFNIDEALFERDGEIDPEMIREAKAMISADELKLDNKMNDFKVNDLIEHPHYGSGTILSTDEGVNAYLIKFDSLATPKSIKKDFQGLSVSKATAPEAQ